MPESEWSCRAHQRALATATSIVALALHDITGRWPDRAEAAEIARRCVRAYCDQFQRVLSQERFHDHRA